MNNLTKLPVRKILYVCLILYIYIYIYICYYPFYHYSENDKVNDVYVKDKLKEALKMKIKGIEERKQIAQAEKKRMERMTKREKERYIQQKLRFNNHNYGKNKIKKTFQDEEKDLHEAYQIILSEHHRRVKYRVKQTLRAVNIMKKLAKPASHDETNDISFRDFSIFDVDIAGESKVG